MYKYVVLKEKELKEGVYDQEAAYFFDTEEEANSKGVDVYAETATPELGVNKAQFTGKRFVAGAPVKFSTYVMKGTDKRNAPLFLLMEFDEKGTPAAMEKYAGEGLIPPGLVVFLANDSIRPTVKGGFTRYMRGTLFAPVGREFPGTMLGLLAYGATMDPPERPLPPNVVPFICGSVYQSHNEEVREKRLAQMREWSAKASSFGVWDYAYGAVQYPLPRMYLKTVGEFFAHKTNDVPSLNAMFAEGSSFMGEGPKRYFHYKMMFDAGQDREALLDAWYRACCGEKAAPFLRAYYDHWEAFWTGAAIRKTPWYNSIGNGYCAFNESTYLYALTREDLKKGAALMERAYEAAMETGDADQKIRAGRLRDFSRYYAARCLGDGACGPLREHGIKDAATAKTFFEALPKMSASMEAAMKYAEKIVAVKRAEPFPMSVHADAALMAKTRANTGVVDWLNDAQGFLGDPQVRAAAEAAAEDRRTSKRYAAILRTLLADPRTSTNRVFGDAADDDAERRLWEPLEGWGIRLDSLVSEPDGNRVFEVTGRPGWPALRKVVPDAKCGKGMLCGFSARVENLSDKPIAVRITYTPGRGLDRKFTVEPGKTGTAELVGTPGAKNTTYYVILNGIPVGGKAKVDRIVLRHLE